MRSGIGQTLRQDPDQLDRGIRILANHAAKQLSRNAQDFEPGPGRGICRSRHIAEDGNLPDDFIGAHHRNDVRVAAGQCDPDLESPLDHNITGVTHRAGLEQLLAGGVRQPLAAETEQLLLRRRQLAKNPESADQLDFLFQTHVISPASSSAINNLVQESLAVHQLGKASIFD